jgi:pimeloyl-ACP methyl ester carboxylesterase
VADLAQACWEAVDEVSDQPTILVGLSVGWHTVMHMANQRPGQTAAIIMSGCSYRGPEPKTYTGPNIAAYTEQGMAARYRGLLTDYSPAFRETDLARYFADIFNERNPWADPASIIEIYRALEPPDPDWLFEDVEAPILIITGSEDNSHQGAFALQKKLPGSELVTMEGAGHACNMERPWEWDGHALDFLTRHGLFKGASAGRP